VYIGFAASSALPEFGQGARPGIFLAGRSRTDSQAMIPMLPDATQQMDFYETFKKGC
jgi:hypothetical protein